MIILLSGDLEYNQKQEYFLLYRKEAYDENNLQFKWKSNE